MIAVETVAVPIVDGGRSTAEVTRTSVSPSTPMSQAPVRSAPVRSAPVWSTQPIGDASSPLSRATPVTLDA